MKSAIGFLTGLGLTLLSVQAMAVSPMCEALLSSPTYQAPTILKPALLDLVNREFDIILSDEKAAYLDHLVNGTEPVSEMSMRNFAASMSELDWINPAQQKEVSVLLKRPVTFDQAKALKLARAIGRTEPGLKRDLPAFSGNYTADQIRRKDRVLQLGGFTLAERFELLADKLVEDVLSNYTAQNLFTDPLPVSPAQAEAMNGVVFKELNRESTAPATGKRKNALNEKEALELYNYVNTFPLFQELRTNSKYDPDGDIGFCFGRAFTADIEARRFGLAKGSIKKAWAVGEMTTFIRWRYHVATIVKAEGGGWWAIDPFHERPLKLEVWFARLKKFNKAGDLRLHATEAARLGPASSNRYTKEELASEAYNGYFATLIEYFREKSLEQKAAKKETPVVAPAPAKKHHWFLRGR